ncbi:MAG: acyl carrier protein [Rickettsiales bacterium]|jgi:acyl carrier protein|nr:acyl carrier protein [Rickettsiales bacterium]
MSNTFDKVKEVVKEKLNITDESKIVPGASFTNDLGADSLDLVEFIMAVEKEFGISIPDEDVQQLSTVGAAVEYIDKHSVKKAA